MGTEIEQCKYNLDAHCTRGIITIRTTDTIGLARYPTCITFYDESSRPDHARELRESEQAMIDKAGSWKPE